MLDGAAVEVRLESDRSDEDGLDCALTLKGGGETFDSILDLLALVLFQFVVSGSELDFADADGVVGSFDRHVHLSGFRAGIGGRPSPGVNIGGDAGDSQRGLDLRDVPEADALKG